MKKLVALSMCLAILLSITSISAAAIKTGNQAAPISPRYEEIVQFNISLNISTSGKASCYADVNTTREFSCLLTVELQKQVSNGWETKKTWTATDDGTGLTYVYEPWYVTHGNYQLKVTAEITDASGKLIEKVVDYSSTVTY